MQTEGGKSEDRVLRFPEGFLWGTATASYQIEGGVHADGRGESIWDRFCQTPGKVFGGNTGDVACDHYHLWKQDVALMKEMSQRAYRFSIAWPRVFPEGKGKANRPGLDFYSRLVDELLQAGIAPVVTLYHWDLPQKLQDAGGWENRETTDRFVEFSREVFLALGDRVRLWITHNEPWVVAFIGNYEGTHAPGKRDFASAVAVSHGLLVSHAKVVQMFHRDFPGCGKIGITLNPRPSHPLEAGDEEATMRADGYINRWFLDPVMRGWYPQDMLDHYRAKGVLSGVDEADRPLLSSVKVDFLGINYYSRQVVHRSTVQPLEFETSIPPHAPVTGVGREIYPEGLYEMLTRIVKDYGSPEIYITENGAAYADREIKDGVVDDADRLDYLKRHFIQAHRAISDGVRLKGYFVWSLMDNFEWATGYSWLFGLARTDYTTQARILKRSGLWYKQVAKANCVTTD